VYLGEYTQNRWVKVPSVGEYTQSQNGTDWQNAEVNLSYSVGAAIAYV
jgi:hypothetical protein